MRVHAAWRRSRPVWLRVALVAQAASVGSFVARETLRYGGGWQAPVDFLLVACSALSISALIRSLIPATSAADQARRAYRLTAAWRALGGHPVAYKVSTENGGLTISDARNAIVAGCVFTAQAQALSLSCPPPTAPDCR